MRRRRRRSSRACCSSRRAPRSADTGANAGAGAGIGDDFAGLAVRRHEVARPASTWPEKASKSAAELSRLGQVLEENSSCEPYNAPTRTPPVRRASALLPLAFPISCALI